MKKALQNTPQDRGFALVVTLSLMILLTIIALGLLTLSSIALRTASRGDAQAVARSNARLALMLALGDLQKFAGPDQRVTARADVTGTSVANPRLTGVWESWNINANSPPSASDYDNRKQDKSAGDGKFLGWLASSIDGKGAEKIDYAKNSFGTDPRKMVTLWGEGSLGNSAPADDIVKAVKVPTVTPRGAFAYAVMDEGIKARIRPPYNQDPAEPNRFSQELLAKIGSGSERLVSNFRKFGHGLGGVAVFLEAAVRLLRDGAINEGGDEGAFSEIFPVGKIQASPEFLPVTGGNPYAQ